MGQPLNILGVVGLFFVYRSDSCRIILFVVCNLLPVKKGVRKYVF